MATRRRAARSVYGAWSLMYPGQGGVLDGDDVPVLFESKAAAEKFRKFWSPEAVPVRVTVRYPLLRPRR